MVRQLWVTLAAMTLAGSMILVDQTAVPMAIAEIMGDLDGPLSLGQWVLTANILPLAAFLVLRGRLGDGFGLKRSFLVGAVVFAVATMAAGLSMNLPWLLTARVVQGLAAAVMLPASVAITSAVWPLERRGFALGLLAGLSAFFAASGPVLGGVLTAVSWRLVGRDPRRGPADHVLYVPERQARRQGRRSHSGGRHDGQAVHRRCHGTRHQECPPPNPRIAQVYKDFIHAHGQSFRVAFVVSPFIALVGAVASWLLVRKIPGPVRAPAFGRRSRWSVVSASVPPLRD